MDKQLKARADQFIEVLEYLTDKSGLGDERALVQAATSVCMTEQMHQLDHAISELSENFRPSRTSGPR